MTAATHTDRLRSIMLVAWDLKRGEPARPFGACLKASWRMAKGTEKVARRLLERGRGGRLVYLSPSVIYSPSSNATRGSRYPGFADRQAGRMISRLGA